MPGFPDLNVVSNVGRTTPPRSVFHVDTSYVRTPPAYTALRAVQIPQRGGETLFTNQYRAFDTLPADVRERLDGPHDARTSSPGSTSDADEETDGRAPGVPAAPGLRAHRALPVHPAALRGDQRDGRGRGAGD